MLIEVQYILKAVSTNAIFDVWNLQYFDHLFVKRSNIFFNQCAVASSNMNDEGKKHIHAFWYCFKIYFGLLIYMFF